MSHSYLQRHMLRLRARSLAGVAARRAKRMASAQAMPDVGGIKTDGIRGETNHRTPEAALKAAKKREGEGWIVIDEAGNQWGRNGNDEAVIVREASNV